MRSGRNKPPVRFRQDAGSRWEFPAGFRRVPVQMEGVRRGGDSVRGTVPMILHPSLEQNEVLSRIVVPDAHAQSCKFPAASKERAAF